MENREHFDIDREIAHRRRVIKLAEKRIRKANALIVIATAEIEALEARRGSG
jgi:hypothetical protein